MLPEVRPTTPEEEGIGAWERFESRSWSEFFALMRTIDIPDNFMADRPMNVPPRESAFT